jgi:hypothetical protein
VGRAVFLNVCVCVCVCVRSLYSYERWRTHPLAHWQFFLWAILGAPLIMGNDIRTTDNWTVELLTSPEVLAVNQDVDCVQGSMARALDATETWIKPMHDGTFAVVLLNKGSQATNASVFFDGFVEYVCVCVCVCARAWSVHRSSFSGHTRVHTSHFAPTVLI